MMMKTSDPYTLAHEVMASLSCKDHIDEQCLRGSNVNYGPWMISAVELLLRIELLRMVNREGEPRALHSH